MTVAVVVPFRSDDPERVRIKEWVLARWGLLHPTYRLIVADDGRESGTFCRSAAVNRGVAQAERDGAEAVIVADADIAVLPDQAEAMVAALADRVPWVIGYARFVHLAKVATAEALKSAPDVSLPQNPVGPVVRFQSWESVCGLWAVRPDDYRFVGGNDERFQGWAPEDVAFAYKADTLLGKAHRVPGVGLHLFHSLRPNRKTDQDARNGYALFTEYEKAAGDPEAMTAIVRASLLAQE